jgi:hypothetical protein
MNISEGFDQGFCEAIIPVRDFCVPDFLSGKA